MGSMRMMWALGFRVGFAFGGDNLIRARMSNGEERTIDAGKGGVLALGAMVTPLWASENIGFGGGVEAGWKGVEISAKNGSISLSRFPLITTLHMLLAASERWSVRLAGGLTKDLGVSLSGDGDVSGHAEFDSSWGGTGEITVYYRQTQSFAIDFGLRYTSLTYSFEDSKVDASSVGFMCGLHLTL